MSRSIVTGVVLSLILAGGNTHAFDLESAGMYAQSNFSGRSFATHLVGFGVARYFEDVNVGAAPHKEAAFMQQIGNLSVAYTRLDPGEFELVSLGVSGEQWFDKTYMSATFEDLSVKGLGSDQVLSAEIGYAPDKNSLFAIGIIDEGADTDMTIRGKLIKPLESDNLVNLELSYLLMDESPVINASAEYFIDQSRSVEFSLQRSDDLNSFGIGGTMFVSPKLAFSAALENGSGVNAVAVGAAYRF